MSGRVKLAALALLFLPTAQPAGQPDIRTVWHRGKPLTYEVVGGLALFQGDIILGTAQELEAIAASGRRDASVLNIPARRWPGGVIPYVIDSDLPNPRRVLDAIEHWNTNTPIRLIPRTAESNYIRFFRQTGTGTCSSFVGMVGGAQRINLDDGCGVVAVIHEIGHAVGLWHEQSRADRDRHVTILFPNIDKRYLHNFVQEIEFGEDVGPYDYASVMHYRATTFSRNGLPTIETIPPGIPIGEAVGLSPGDIDAVRWMYGQTAGRVTIATNPPGLEVVVDGARHIAPVSFDWAPGSVHTIGVESPQGGGATRYVFARWSDEGASTHRITVSESVRVYTAHFAVQHRFSVGVSPVGSGNVVLEPAPQEGYYTARSMVRMTPVPAPGFSFLGWAGTQGGSANPKEVMIRGENAVTAQFTRSPVTTIATNPPGLTVIVDGTRYTAPQSFTWAPGSTHTIGVSTPQTSVAARYVFRDWSDGGAQTHTITASAESQTFTANFTTQYLFTITGAGGGSVTRTPDASDNYYDEGTTVELRAAPNTGFVFDYWTGDLGGRANPQTLIVRTQHVVSARFRRPSTASFAVVNGASYEAGGVAPGQIVTLFGSNLGPETAVGLQLDSSGRVATQLAGTRILFDGVPAPLIAVQARQSSAVTPFSVAGKTVVLVTVEYLGQRTQSLFVPVVTAAPGIFTLDQSGRGQGAILNQDGVTVNSPENPAARGSVVSLFATGAGETEPPSQDGVVAWGILPAPRLPVAVRIGGATAEVLYAGAAPGLVSGVLQVNVRVPWNIEPGDYVPVELTVGRATSLPAVTMSVR
ncbi:MAG: M12 family metallopeptidase [Bryobacterales bacterium]|nr:M12 family metallopeptidase [Bryobacteraceae bacterium]MDW8356000.1 M12 family metallopeptidase [Bryobacterales bacterium]